MPRHLSSCFFLVFLLNMQEGINRCNFLNPLNAIDSRGFNLREWPQGAHLLSLLTSLLLILQETH